jgi:hypothetical protein
MLRSKPKNRPRRKKHALKIGGDQRKFQHSIFKPWNTEIPTKNSINDFKPIYFNRKNWDDIHPSLILLVKSLTDTLLWKSPTKEK